MSAIAVLSVSVLAACTSSSSSTSANSTSSSNSTGPITIGASLSETGNFAADGLAFKKGYELWAKDVNAHGGLLGRQVKLVIVNDNSSPDQVVTNYQRLFGTEHVDLAFGPFSSLLTEPASSVAARFGMAFINYLHSGVTLNTVQGQVKFDSLGENGAAAAFVFQWQGGDFKQVLPTDAADSVSILVTKPDWTTIP